MSNTINVLPSFEDLSKSLLGLNYHDRIAFASDLGLKFKQNPLLKTFLEEILFVCPSHNVFHHY